MSVNESNKYIKELPMGNSIKGEEVDFKNYKLKY